MSDREMDRDVERTGEQETDGAERGHATAGGAFSLFTEDGPLWHYPGPALVVGGNGVVLAANAKARPLVEMLTRGSRHELRAALDDALSGRSAQISPLVIDAGLLSTDGDSQALDLAVMPWGQGTAALILGRDVTLERNLREALIESRQRYKDLIEASHEFVWETDAKGCFSFVSPRGALGYGAKDLIGRRAEELLVEDEPAPGPFSAEAALEDVEVWVSRADDEPACLLLNAAPLRGPDGRWRGARGVASDVTERRQQESDRARSRNQERLLSYILGLIRGELEPGRMLEAAAAALMPALPVAGVAVYRLAVEGGGSPHRAVETGVLIPEELLEEALEELDGEEMTVDLETDAGLLMLHTTAHQGRVNGAICLWRGLSEGPWCEEDRGLVEELTVQLGLAIEQLRRQEALEKESAIDPLTGLLNRRSFERSLEERLLQAPGAWRDGVLFYVDLDNFKQVNDRYGHDRGDAALVAVAGILNRFTRRQDLAARLGGDEFALFLVDIPIEAARRKARTLVRAAGQLKPFSPPEGPALGFSVGLAVTDPNRRETLEALMKRADKAMYEVKHGGKSGLAIAPGCREEDAA
ncbi:MAG: diguanylate cyclase [Kiloniellales bacterium]|nr:diguanylate cyclase [Kiloniellales bacterium]